MKKEFALEEAEILDKHKGISKEKQVFVDWMFNAEAAKSRLVSAFMPMGIELMKESAKFAFDIADDPERELELTDRLREYIRDRVDRFATDTGDETVAAIDQTIAEGVKIGESVAKLRKRIQEVYEQADKVRANRIARTETLAVSNEAANEAYRQSPMVTGKEWSVEIDACPFCQQFAGKVIGLNEEFVKVGDTVKDDDGHELHVDYENVQHPPLHPNCKCALLPVSQK
jgi:SPP1 gp7 family putative phage head morphogenesis protein